MLALSAACWLPVAWFVTPTFGRRSVYSRTAPTAPVVRPEALARRVASMQALLSVFDIVVEAAATGRPQEAVMTAYFDIGARLGLDWLRDRVLELPRADRWQALARAALRDDMYELHRSLTREVLGTGRQPKS